MTRGILIECSRKEEWILPWWWSKYTKFNRYPVAFIDVNLSLRAQVWCQARGNWIPLNASLSPAKNRYKPLVLSQTLFEETISIDLHCEVVASLTPLFDKIHAHSKIGFSKSPSLALKPIHYDLSVIPYHRDSPLLKRWGELCTSSGILKADESDLLHAIIHEESVEIVELPCKFNWKVQAGVNLEAIILHWPGKWGRKVLKREVLSYPFLLKS